MPPETIAKDACLSDNNSTCHQQVGLTDAVGSGWLQSASGELFTGFPIGSDDVVVDVGCGEGLASHFCARQGAHVIFTDPDPAKITFVSQRLNSVAPSRHEGYVSDSQPLPITDGTATRVIAMEVLEHLRRPQQLLEELRRVGKPGALYLITVPDARSERVQEELAPPIYFQPPNHIQVFEEADFRSLVESAGLTVELYATSGFYWSMWWCLNWLTRDNDVTGAVLDTVPTTDHPVLEAWSQVWTTLLDDSASKPLRTALNRAMPKSQIIVARKPAN